MFIGVVYIEIFIPESSSLKEKRQVLRSIKDRIRSNFNVSVAEIDHQDLWQRSGLAIVCVGDSINFTKEITTKIKNFVEKHYPHFLIGFKHDHFKVDLT